jgi:hypothetical protein
MFSQLKGKSEKLTWPSWLPFVKLINISVILYSQDFFVSIITVIQTFKQKLLLFLKISEGKQTYTFFYIQRTSLCGNEDIKYSNILNKLHEVFYRQFKDYKKVEN